MNFKYKIQTKDNKVIEGSKESLDKFSLARDLREGGNIPLSITEFKDKDKEKISLFKIDIFGSVSLSEKMIFTNNLSGMLLAGLSLTRALSILQKQSTNQTFNKILTTLVDDVSKGNTFWNIYSYGSCRRRVRRSTSSTF